GLSKLSDTGLIDLFPAENVVRIDKFLVHNPITNGKHAAGAAKLALALPDGAIKARVINDLLSQERALPHEIASSLERALIGLSEGYRTETETETETETDTDTLPCHEEGICTDTGEVIALPRGRAC